jgi:hypothetical protein
MSDIVNISIEYERPQIIRKYKKQVAFIDAPTKHAIVEATSKAGKTVGMLVWLFEQALDDIPGRINKDGCYYWWVAPVSGVALIAFRRMKRFISSKELFTTNETEHSIHLINGAVIQFKSADKPDSLYGEDVYAVVLDESTRMKEQAYIAVDSTLTATDGSMRIIGNVKGTNNWAYKLAREVELKKLKAWSYFKLTAGDAIKAGVLKQSVLDEKRSRLPEGVFLELYYAIPFVNSSNKFAFSYSGKKHINKCRVNYDHPIYLSFDFNRNPISCVIVQYYEERVRIPFVIKLENSDIYRLCTYIKNKFTAPGRPEPYFIVNGDASGKAGSAMVKDNLNYFRIIKSEMNLSTGQMQQLAVNPSIEENQVLVNAVLEHVAMDIDPDNAQPLIFDLEFAEMLPDGTLKKGDRNDPAQQLDALDGFRYWVNRNMRHFLKGHK